MYVYILYCVGGSRSVTYSTCNHEVRYETAAILGGSGPGRLPQVQCLFGHHHHHHHSSCNLYQ